MFLITTHRLSVQQTRFTFKFSVFTVKSPAFKILSELQQEENHFNPLNVFVLILEKNCDVSDIEFID